MSRLEILRLDKEGKLAISTANVVYKKVFNLC